MITPVMAAAAAVSGETRYTFASAVPERPLKLRLKVRRDTPSVLGANPIPIQGPQALSKMRNPARIKSPKIPAFSAISKVVRLPGAIPASTPGAMCLPRTMAATAARSSKELLVQEPIQTWVTVSPATEAISATASGEWGLAARGLRVSKSISIILS